MMLFLACKRHKLLNSCNHLLVQLHFVVTCFPTTRHLTPLTAQVGKKKLDWTPERCQKAFETIKALLAKDAF
jgi:hypothetical protein